MAFDEISYKLAKKAKEMGQQISDELVAKAKDLGVTYFRTYADLKAKYPTVTDGVFYVIEDNGYYKFDEQMNMWINQTGISDIMSNITLATGYLINASYVLAANAAFSVSGYIDVSKFSRMLVKDNNFTPSIVFYDENQSPISSVNGGSTTGTLFATIDVNAKYAKVVFANSSLSDSFIRLMGLSKNMLPKTTVINGSYTGSAGETITNASFAHTELIPVINIKDVTILNKLISPIITFWDSNSSFLSSVNGTAASGEITFSIPNGVMYFSINFSKSSVASSYVLTRSLANDFNKLPIIPNSVAKHMTNIGDSLTSYNKWQQQVVNKLKLEGYDILAVAGGFLTTQMSDYLTNINKKTDIVTIWGGTNDWSYGYALGSFTDTVASGTAFIPTLRYMVEYISQNYPTTKIVLITPAQRFVNTPESSPNTEYTITTKGLYANSNGNTLEDFVNAIKEVADYYGCKSVDLYHSGIVNGKNHTQYYVDKIHHNKAGGILHGNIIANAIMQLF